MRIILVSTFILLICSCSSNEVEQDIDASELKLYTIAQRALRSGNHEEAVNRLQTLEARFPFGRYAQQSQLEIIYAYYKSSQPEAARAAAERFIRLHPSHPNVDYAYYLKGLASFEEDQNFLEKFLPLNPATRDSGSAKQAFADFSDLVRRFPNSEYAPDAHQRMVYLRNLLAEHELNVARYYIRRGAFIAAANRGRYVFEHFQQTPSVPDALAIMVQAYQLLNRQDLAQEALIVLTTNFPDYPSLDGARKLREAKSNSSSHKP